MNIKILGPSDPFGAVSKFMQEIVNVYFVAILHASLHSLARRRESLALSRLRDLYTFCQTSMDDHGGATKTKLCHAVFRGGTRLFGLLSSQQRLGCHILLCLDELWSKVKSSNANVDCE